MTVSNRQREVVENLFKAMQAGPTAESQMMALFADDAVFIEPFSGQPQTHVGLDAIRASFQAMWADPVPDLSLTLDRVDLDGEQVRVDWTCTSPVFPTPMRGHDLFVINGSKIVRLEIIVTEMPPMGE